MNWNRFFIVALAGYISGGMYVQYHRWTAQAQELELFRTNPVYLEYASLKHMQQTAQLSKETIKESPEKELAAKVTSDMDELQASLEKRIAPLDQERIKSGEDRQRELEGTVKNAMATGELILLGSLVAGYLWGIKGGNSPEQNNTPDNV